jgi:methionyl-tRNA synthetase
VAREVVAEYRAAMESLAFQSALRALWRLLAEANQYLVAREPWKKVKTEGPTETLSRVLWNGLEAVRIVTSGLLPFMPELAPRVLAGIGVETPPTTLDALAWGGLPNGAALEPLAPLFPRIDKEKYMAEITNPPAPAPAVTAPTPAAAPAPAGTVAPVAEARAEGTANLIDIAQFATVELKVGQVLSCENLPKSEKLLKMMVDLGEERPRQVLAGIAKAYKPEELAGTQVVIVANLKPAKLMGQESQGMVLAATDAAGQPVLLRPHAPGVPAGTRVK